jgi:ribosomal protein S6
MQYELFYLIGESKEQDLEKIKGDIKKIVTDEGGKFQEPEIIEKRKMAYKIKSDFRGSYIAQRFSLPEKDADENIGENTIQKINKQINLYRNILRFILIKADELPELKAREEIKRTKEIPKAARKTFKPAPVKTVETKKAEEKMGGEKSLDEKLEEILNI